MRNNSKTLEKGRPFSAQINSVPQKIAFFHIISLRGCYMHSNRTPHLQFRKKERKKKNGSYLQKTLPNVVSHILCSCFPGNLFTNIWNEVDPQPGHIPCKNYFSPANMLRHRSCVHVGRIQVGFLCSHHLLGYI